jgi:hypothetical protein
MNVPHLVETSLRLTHTHTHLSTVYCSLLGYKILRYRQRYNFYLCMPWSYMGAEGPRILNLITIGDERWLSHSSHSISGGWSHGTLQVGATVCPSASIIVSENRQVSYSCFAMWKKIAFVDCSIFVVESPIAPLVLPFIHKVFEYFEWA